MHAIIVNDGGGGEVRVSLNPPYDFGDGSP
jgi:hypothetical protein